MEVAEHIAVLLFGVIIFLKIDENQGHTRPINIQSARRTTPWLRWCDRADILSGLRRGGDPGVVDCDQ